jgi:hypothetical protein
MPPWVRLILLTFLIPADGSWEGGLSLALDRALAEWEDEAW